jgi:hypothetical protein
MSSEYQKVVSAVKSSASQDLTPVQAKSVLKALPELKKVYDKIRKWFWKT